MTVPEHAPSARHTQPASAAQVVDVELALQACFVPKHRPMVGYVQPSTDMQFEITIDEQDVVLGVPMHRGADPPSMAALESSVSPIAMSRAESRIPPSTAPPWPATPPVLIVPPRPVTPPVPIPPDPVAPPVRADPPFPVTVPPAPVPPTPPPATPPVPRTPPVAVPPVAAPTSAEGAASCDDALVLLPQPLPTSGRVQPRITSNQQSRLNFTPQVSARAPPRSPRKARCRAARVAEPTASGGEVRFRGRQGTWGRRSPAGSGTC